MKNINFLFIFLLLSAIIACYNSPVMSGYVFDYDTGKPVKGALVKFYSGCITSPCKGNYRSVITDDKGRYKINIKDKEKIINDKFYIEVIKEGYVTLNDNYSLSKDNKLSIYLKESTSREF